MRTCLALLVLLSACAPSVQPFGAFDRPPAIEAEALIAADGRRLPLRAWPSEASAPKAVLVALHGFNDYSKAFEAPARWWASMGLTVYAYDQRGFGADPQAGIWGGAEAMASDLRAAIVAAGARHPGVPLFLLGESMGGAVAVLAASRHGLDGVAGTILSAPALWGGESLNPFYRLALSVSAHVAPGRNVTGRGIDVFASDNLDMLRALGRDPLVIKETRIDALYGLVGLMDAALAATPAMPGPLLVLYGRHEEIVPEESARRFVARLGGAPRLAAYDKGWHMLLRDLQAETVWRDVLAFVTDPAAPLPSGAEVDELPPFLKRGSS